MKTLLLHGRRVTAAGLCWLAGACSPSLLDDCTTNDDCAEGVCEEGYCVTRVDAASPDAVASKDAAGAGGAAGAHDAAPPGPDASSQIADLGAPTPDAAAPPTPDARPADAAPSMDAAVTDDAAVSADAAPPPDAMTPDVGPPPPAVVGVCGADTDVLPLWDQAGEPCITLESAAVWSFEGGYAARGGGGRAINASPDDNLAPGALTFIESPFDQAASFLGSDDLWQGASVRSSVRNTGPMTIEAWIRVSPNSVGGAIVSTLNDCDFDQVTAGWQVGLRRQEDPVGFIPYLEVFDGVDAQFGGSLRFPFDQGIVLSPGPWHHLVVVFEGQGQVPTSVWGWLDGFQMGEMPTPNLGPINEASWLHLGTRANCVVQALQFDIDALRILNRSLTLDELNAAPPPAGPLPDVP